MRVLITGVTGFAGTYLARFLSQKKGLALFGLRRPRSKKEAPAGVRLLDCDIREEGTLYRILKKFKPERIFHLAAFASVARSWEHPEQAFEDNVTGTRSLLEGVRRACPRARVHVAGSAEVYGLCRPQRARLKEDAPFWPLNPYAASKIAQDALAQQYVLSHGLHVVRTRAFNHIGPGQSDIYVASDFAKQVARVEAHRQKPVIEVGNLNVVRDFTDVRDVVRAYWLCLERGVPGEAYNVCSGRPRRVSEILKFYLRLSTARIAVRKNKKRFRAVDAPVLVGDSSKIRRRTGWRPAIGFERTLRDILDDWREKCAY